MRALIQRVARAGIQVEGKSIASCGPGLLVLLGIEEADDAADINWLCQKILQLRIFPDDEGIMNKDIREVNGEIMLVSQFTLHASTKKGNRPSYIRAAKPELAKPLYEQMVATMEEALKKSIAKGQFGAHMMIELVNDGPVTIMIDSKNRE